MGSSSPRSFGFYMVAPAGPGTPAENMDADSTGQGPADTRTNVEVFPAPRDFGRYGSQVPGGYDQHHRISPRYQKMNWWSRLMQWFKGAKYPEHEREYDPLKPDSDKRMNGIDREFEEFSQSTVNMQAADKEIDLLNRTIEDLRIKDIKVNNGE